MERTEIVDSNQQSLSLQPNDHVSVVPSDTIDNVPNCPIYVGTGGTITLLFKKSTTAIQYTVADGYIFPCSVRRVLSSGTSATGIVAWFTKIN